MDQDSKKYSKKTDREHVLDLPGMYIDSIEPTENEVWTTNHCDLEKLDSIHMIWHSIVLVKGFYKIFDEVLQNAFDHATRTRLAQDSEYKTTQIKIDVDVTTGTISVWNNGDGIPVHEHSEYKLWIPFMIFGELRTSSNYNKEEKRTVGGMNGYGAKLANIFSSSFTVETVDAKRHLKFKQTWTQNMSFTKPPKITETNSSAKPFTCITFTPDYARFRMALPLSNDIQCLFLKRAFDMAALSNITVFYNNVKIPIKNFFKYADLFVTSSESELESNLSLPEEKKHKWIQETVYQPHQSGEVAWQIALLADGSMQNEFQHVSYVNGISTFQGGKHVEWIADKICKYVMTEVNQKRKANESEIQKRHIKNNMFLMINCFIQNPSFPNQIKSELNSSVTTFFPLNFSEAFLKKVLKSHVVTKALATKEFQEQKLLLKQDLSNQNSSKKASVIYGIPKLEDALWAGTAKSHLCTLMITEGDSAKTFCLRARPNNQQYGVYPLKGKLTNVRGTTLIQILRDVNQSKAKGNIGLKEILEIRKILGLPFDANVSKDKLRYGSIMLFTDQDPDGSHIKGLIINLFEVLYPSLLKQDFIKSVYTPLVRIYHRSGKEVAVFYSESDFEKWLQHHDLQKEHLTTHFKKGLGSNTPLEAKAYGKNIKYATVTMDPLASEHLNMVFNDKLADQRKKWICEYRGKTLDYDQKQVSVSDFLHYDMILHPIHNIQRTLPGFMDGFKPVQRKVIQVILSYMDKSSKRAREEEHKIESLAGEVGKKMNYHHGATSMHEAILKMGQTFVGCGNLNLLVPAGEFGTRSKGGKDAAQPRYPFTYGDQILRAIFRKEDTPLLKMNVDEDKEVEPNCFYPVIMLPLVNGVSGVGTAFSSDILCYHPLEIIENQKRFLQHQDMKLMKPFYRGFQGSIVATLGTTGIWISKATWKRLSEPSHPVQKIHITELPLFTWTEPYMEFLESLVNQQQSIKQEKQEKDDEKAQANKAQAKAKKAPSKTAKKKKWAQQMKKFRFEKGPHHDPIRRIDLILEWQQEEMMTDEDIEEFFKLTRSMNENNMHMNDPYGHVMKFQTPLDMLQTFCHYRLAIYEQRKVHILKQYQRELSILEQKARFILAILQGQLVLYKKNKQDILQQLRQHTFLTWEQIPSIEVEMLPVQTWIQASDPYVVKNAQIYNRCYTLEQQEEEEEQKKQVKNNKNDPDIKMKTEDCDMDEDIDANDNDNDNDDDNETKQISKSSSSGYDYLLRTSIYQMTDDAYQKLIQQITEKKQDIQCLQQTTAAQLWIRDMDEFVKEYHLHMQRFALIESQTSV